MSAISKQNEMDKERSIIEEIGRELSKQPFPDNPYTLNIHNVGLPIGNVGSMSPAEILAQIRRENARKEEAEKEKLAAQLGEDGLFRFGYVPFVIGELVWDYADTVVDLASLMKLSKVRPLSRVIRNLRADYLRLHNSFVDQQHHDSEVRNMYVFEENVKQIFELYIVNLKCDLSREYPDLSSESITFLTAVYQCWVVLKSLLLYASKQSEKVARIVGHPIGNIIPIQLRKLADLILVFAGDSPASKRFEKEQEKYIQTLATQIALVELTPIKEDETN